MKPQLTPDFWLLIFAMWLLGETISIYPLFVAETLAIGAGTVPAGGHLADIDLIVLLLPVEGRQLPSVEVH